MNNYTKTSSSYIKAKIAETDYENRGYIDQLLRIERYARDDIGGALNNWGIGVLRKTYAHDFEEILKEVNYVKYLREYVPEEYLEYLKNHDPRKYRKEIKENERFLRTVQEREKEEQKEREAEKVDWISAGGNVGKKRKSK